jgi:beta-N-acetylhexosaminidase
VQIHVVNREIFQPFLTGVAILHACHFLAPSEFAWRTEAYEFVDHAMAIDLLCGSPQIRMAIEAGTHLHEIAETWLPEQQRFSNDRTHFLLYPDE